MTKWFQKPKTSTLELKKSEKLKNLSEEALRILALRGFTKPEEAEAFLYGEIADLHDPRLLKGAEKAVQLIKQAISEQKNIVVYGDYDCDGVTSTATMTMLLREAGGQTEFWTNNRFTHGYGISPHGVDGMLKKYPDTDMIITVDNGISAHAGIDYAKAKGMTVVVTDHHDPAETTPLADAVVNPKQHGCSYPFKGLCGAGVALKVMALLYWEMKLPLEQVYEKLDIVALGTIADVVPLVDENRILVKKGMEQIQREDRMAFRLLRQLCEVKKVAAHSAISYKYAPIMNSVGRLEGDPLKAINFFLETDETSATLALRDLIEINDTRKAMTVEQTEIAQRLVEDQGLDFVNILYHPDLHEGLVGLIAGRLKEDYNRPFFVFTANGDHIKGSGRGIEGMHLKEELDAVKSLVMGYGGHAKACGLSMKLEQKDELKEKLNIRARELYTEDDFVKKIYVELPLRPEDLTTELIDSLEMLEPFGEAFPVPIVGVAGFAVGKVYEMGTEKQHLKLQSKDVSLVAWNAAEMYSELGYPKHVKAIGYPELNFWNGQSSVQFMVAKDQLRAI